MMINYYYQWAWSSFQERKSGGNRTNMQYYAWWVEFPHYWQTFIYGLFSFPLSLLLSLHNSYIYKQAKVVPGESLIAVSQYRLLFFSLSFLLLLSQHPLSTSWSCFHRCWGIAPVSSLQVLRETLFDCWLICLKCRGHLPDGGGKAKKN